MRPASNPIPASAWFALVVLVALVGGLGVAVVVLLDELVERARPDVVAVVVLDLDERDTPRAPPPSQSLSAPRVLAFQRARVVVVGTVRRQVKANGGRVADGWTATRLGGGVVRQAASKGARGPTWSHDLTGPGEPRVVLR